MKKFGIDISHWQGSFDFVCAKGEGAEFVILKAGGGDNGLYKDSKFERNYSAARFAGYGIGAYFFGKAFSVETAITEADRFISILEGKRFEYPVFYDVEAKMLKQDKDKLTDIILAFLERTEQAGYMTGIYSSEYNFNHDFDDSRLERFPHWVAKYSASEPTLGSGAPVGIWQFGGEVNKIRSNKIAGVVCDQNYCYTDYPSMIKERELNGFKGYTEESEPIEAAKLQQFLVKVETPYLNIRRGPGTNYALTGKYTGKGIFTIVDVQPGIGSKTGWGKLKSGAGWISLDFAKRI